MGRGLQLAFLAGALVWESASAKSVKAIVPTTEQIAISERASDCGVMVSLTRRFDEALRNIAQDMESATTVVNALFGRLEHCAKNHGLAFSDEGATIQEEIAMSCPAEYEEWVQYSYRVLMLEDERETTQGKKNEAARFLGNCPASRNEVIKGTISGELF